MSKYGPEWGSPNEDGSEALRLKQERDAMPPDFQDFLRRAMEAGSGVRITVLGEGENSVTFVARWADRDGPEVDYRCEGDRLIRTTAPNETQQ